MGPSGHTPSGRSLRGTYAGCSGASCPGSISVSSTALGGDARGATAGSPMETRILRAISGSVMNEISRSRPEAQLGQSRVSIPSTRVSSCAQVFRRRFSAGKSSQSPGPGCPPWAHGPSGTGSGGTMLGRSRAWGASTRARRRPRELHARRQIRALLCHRRQAAAGLVQAPAIWCEVRAQALGPRQPTAHAW